MRTRVATALLALLLAGPARACSVCGCGDPLLSAGDPAALSGILRLGLETEYLHVTAANEEAPALTDALDQYTLRLSGVYSPTPELSLILLLPLMRKDLRTAGVTASDLTGLGDVELGARYTLLDLPDFARARRQSLAVSLGTSIPTGLRAAEVNGIPVDEHGQLGTGAWGPYAGVHYRWEERAWTLFASLSGRLRTTNAEGYQYGDALLWSAHAQLWADTRLALDAGVDGRWAAADARDGAAVVATGGLLLAAAPGVYWNVSGPFWLSARAQIPFFTHLYGIQTVGPTVVAGLQVQIL